MNNKRIIQNRTRSIQNIYTGAFSLLLFLGLAVCVICDIVISHSFTWSLYPISSIIFAWLVLTPIIRFGEKGILGALISSSVFIVPFLYVLDKLMRSSSLFLPASIKIAFIGIVYLWLVFILFHALKRRKLMAAAVSLLLTIPTYILISFTLSKIISSAFDVWNMGSFLIVILTASVLVIFDFIVKEKIEGKNN